MLLELKAVLTSTSDNKNQTPLSLVLSKGRDGVVKVILGWVNANFDTSERPLQVCPPPPAEQRDKYAVEM